MPPQEAETLIGCLSLPIPTARNSFPQAWQRGANESSVGGAKTLQRTRMEASGLETSPPANEEEAEGSRATDVSGDSQGNGGLLQW